MELVKGAGGGYQSSRRVKSRSKSRSRDKGFASNGNLSKDEMGASNGFDSYRSRNSSNNKFNSLKFNSNRTRQLS